MSGRQFCQNCNRSNGCPGVYEQLGKAEGPSVASKVAAAFLLPAIAFIGSLAAFDAIFAGVTNALRPLFSFLSAVAVTSVLVLTMKKCRTNACKKH